MNDDPKAIARALRAEAERIRDQAEARMAVLLSFSARRMASFVLENGPLVVKGLRFYGAALRSEVRLPFSTNNGTATACYHLMEDIVTHKPTTSGRDLVYVFEGWLGRGGAA